VSFPPRCVTLPPFGSLLASTDLHGNLADYLALEQLFVVAREKSEDVHWAILGDLVHGPNLDDAGREPHLYGYKDESPELIARLVLLHEQHAGHVHIVLGNHDHGHVGGLRTAKFHDDEVEHLESLLNDEERAQMHRLFEGGSLVLLAPCGALMSHGSPGPELLSLAQLEGPLVGPEGGDEPGRLRWRAIQSVLWSYGQSPSVTNAMLSRLSVEAGFRLKFVIHGHDRDEQGLVIEGENQLQPVIFGALKAEKRYLWLDLGTEYTNLRKLREGHEIRRLYPDCEPAL